MVVIGFKEVRLKQGDQGRAVSRAHGTRTRPGAVGWRGGWVGEARQPEKR